MKALVCQAPGTMQLQDITKPVLEENRALLRITRIGICGTDLHAYEGTQPFFSYPRILGHELAAEIVEIDGTDRFRKGELVTFIPYLNCGKCTVCLQGKTNCCVNIKVFGVHIDGGMAEYISVPTRLLLKVNGITPDTVALIEPFAIAAHAVARAKVRTGDNVMIAGAGPIGIAIMFFAKMAGANVIAVDVNEDRLRFTREQVGIEKTIHPLKGDAISQLAEFTQEDNASVVFDATGNLHALEQGFKYMGHGSTYVLVGLQLKNVSFSHPEFHKREGTLMSSRNATAEDFQNVIDSIASRKIDPLKMVTHHVKFGSVQKEFPRWLDPESKVIKVIVELD
jgi:2-desacetyl-2-hydroxyethyl bacteriochlorophyllide A dehydrogenase